MSNSPRYLPRYDLHIISKLNLQTTDLLIQVIYMYMTNNKCENTSRWHNTGYTDCQSEKQPANTILCLLSISQLLIQFDKTPWNPFVLTFWTSPHWRNFKRPAELHVYHIYCLSSIFLVTWRVVGACNGQPGKVEPSADTQPPPQKSQSDLRGRISCAQYYATWRVSNLIDGIISTYWE